MNRNRRRKPALPQQQTVKRAARRLDLLTAEFDMLFESQQTAGAWKAMKRAFAATPQRMGKVAADAARRVR